jgi:hypothetical protein
MNDVRDLENRLKIARERLRQAFITAAEMKGRWWEAYGAANQAVLSLERQLAAASKDTNDDGSKPTRR